VLLKDRNQIATQSFYIILPVSDAYQDCSSLDPFLLLTRPSTSKPSSIFVAFVLSQVLYFQTLAEHWHGNLLLGFASSLLLTDPELKLSFEPSPEISATYTSGYFLAHYAKRCT